MTHCFTCEFARALVAAVALALAIGLIAAVCLTGAHGSENVVVMNANPAHNTTTTREFVVILVAAVAATVLVVIANSDGGKQ